MWCLIWLILTIVLSRSVVTSVNTSNGLSVIGKAVQCLVEEQSILTTKLNNFIAPLVEKLKDKCWQDSTKSCQRQDCINQQVICRSPPQEILILREHLLFGCTHGKFVEDQHWKRCERVGTSRAGSCWVAQLMECPFKFAVKETLLDSSPKGRRNLDEVYCSIKMKYLEEHVCPHIIDYYGVTVVRKPNVLPFMDPPLLLHIYMELMSCSLHSFLVKNGPLPFDKVSDFSYQLFSALEFLHTKFRILHRNIKPGNILVASTEQRIKLSDFDCATLLDKWNVNDVFRGDPQGTSHYNPPESYHHHQSSFSLDVWQAACCVLFMMTGLRPWRHVYFDCDDNYKQKDQARFTMQQKISERHRHILPGFLPPTLHTILSICLHDDWTNRPSAVDVMYQLDPSERSRSKLLSNLDIRHEAGPYVSSTKPSTTTTQTHSQTIDIYLAEYTERLPGLYLQPGWIASIPITGTVTYGEVKELIYNNTELEVMKYLNPSKFYVYDNDRIKIRQLLVEDRTMDHFAEIIDNDTLVDTTKAIIMHVTKCPVVDPLYPLVELEPSSILSSRVKVINKESCPLKDCDIVTMTFDSKGGVFVIEEYAFNLTVPSGAIENDVIVEIQAAVSLFGPFIVHKDYQVISGFVWIGACYKFKKELILEIEHHADITNEDDISDLCVLKACMKHEHELNEMHEVPVGQYQYSVGSSFCTYFNKHFCSLCLVKKNINIPDRIMVYHYLPENYKSAIEFKSEVCFCYDFTPCKKATEKRFLKRRMINKLAFPIRVLLKKEDELHLKDSNTVHGWNVVHLIKTEIIIDEIDFRRWYKSVDALKHDENIDAYPPRFFTQVNCHEPSTLDVNYMLHVIKEGSVVHKYQFNIYVNATEIANSIKNIGLAKQSSPSIAEPDKPSGLLEKKPDPWIFTKIFIPKIQAEWKDVALSLRFSPCTIDVIKRESHDLKDFCQNLMFKWLDTNHGKSPKTWQTLLECIEDVDNLTVAAEELKIELMDYLCTNEQCCCKDAKCGIIHGASEESQHQLSPAESSGSGPKQLQCELPKENYYIPETHSHGKSSVASKYDLLPEFRVIIAERDELHKKLVDLEKRNLLQYNQNQRRREGKEKID
ncbi:uncharacterized protein [Dysidea avara]|uniref:uncharacterized protein isoform X3 n=1 Tax=Dysidea avara TaxID=196820 RepID=UPI0033346701